MYVELIAGIVCGLLVFGYVSWLQLKVWYLGQQVQRSTVIVSHPEGWNQEGRGQEAGCITSLILISVLLTIPFAMFVRFLEIV